MEVGVAAEVVEMEDEVAAVEEAEEVVVVVEEVEEVTGFVAGVGVETVLEVEEEVEEGSQKVISLVRT